MNHAVKMHELEQQKGTREYYSGEKPATSFPLQNVFANLNPFQKNISKSVNVLDSITNNSGMAYITDWMTPNCQSISINRQRFDELLSSGVKITTAFEWKQSIPKLNTGGHEYQWVANLNSYDDKCVGQTYILEGPENLLNKL